MVQRIKVQSGRVIYEASNAAYDLNMDVSGRINVSKELNVGNDPLADGLISAADGVDLILETTSGGNINLDPGPGAVVIDGTAWPTTTTAVDGTYIGSTGLNTLEFLSFILSPPAVSDTLTSSALNTLYPTAQVGQSVLGPSVLYKKVGPATWRTISTTSGSLDSTTPYYIPIGEVFVNNINRQNLYSLPITVDGDLVVDGYIVEVD